jgi:hypothetical protein
VDVLLLLDPSCGYSLSLGLDVLGAATQLLLSHASAAAGMAVALVLLVLSHQMSSLVHVMSVARHGTPVGPAAAALVRAGGLALSSDSNNSSVSHQQQQQLAHSSGVTSLQLTASPPSPAPPNNSGAALLGLQSPAAGVARRLVGSASPRGALGADVNNVTSDGRDSDSDSSRDGSSRSSSEYGGGELLPLKHSRSHHQQPCVAGDAVPLAAADSIRQPGDGGSSLAVVPANIRQASLAAMQRMRRHMTGTLGGAPPPVQQQLVAAAAASGRAAARLQHSSTTDSGGGNESSSSGSRRRRPGGHLQQFTNSRGGLGRAVSSLLLPLRWMGLLQPANSHRRRKRRAGRRQAGDGRPRHAHSSRSGSSFVVRSWAGAGISVVGSLVAVTGDLRVLLLAAGLSAGAGALNRLNPGSIWNPHNQQQQQHVDVAPLASPLFASGGGATAPHYSSSASAAATHACSWVLQQALSLAGLQQRGDSPGLVGAAVLLCVALLLQLGAVALSVALKWVLDYAQGAVAAFHRCWLLLLLLLLSPRAWLATHIHFAAAAAAAAKPPQVAHA